MTNNGGRRATFDCYEILTRLELELAEARRGARYGSKYWSRRVQILEERHSYFSEIVRIMRLQEFLCAEEDRKNIELLKANDPIMAEGVVPVNSANPITEFQDNPCDFKEKNIIVVDNFLSIEGYVEIVYEEAVRKIEGGRQVEEEELNEDEETSVVWSKPLFCDGDLGIDPGKDGADIRRMGVVIANKFFLLEDHKLCWLGLRKQIYSKYLFHWNGKVLFFYPNTRKALIYSKYLFFWDGSCQMSDGNSGSSSFEERVNGVIRDGRQKWWCPDGSRSCPGGLAWCPGGLAWCPGPGGFPGKGVLVRE